MTTPNVWLFYANQIGYGRIVSSLLSFYFMDSQPVVAIILYTLSAGLDAVDGYMARKYHQSSRFGAMLDQLTDRCSTMALVMTLGSFYPKYLFFFQCSAILDIAAHWLHLHAADLTGKTTHKLSANRILNLYYTSKNFLFFMCAGNEAFYGLLYLYHFWSGPSFLGFSFVSLLVIITFPVAFLKSMISIVHLCTAAATVVQHDIHQIESKRG
ncbi:hypothetical protein AB6A40_002216 [Gnathostoma spinigerum]|uniref:CDP-diacylglycerol--inositol 3-phosphatidyltransferase n=1 Tax=Gnathostoma spinigerum TaxID=75299 RepID=A0ABD6E889_9BILA